MKRTRRIVEAYLQDKGKGTERRCAWIYRVDTLLVIIGNLLTSLLRKYLFMLIGVPKGHERLVGTTVGSADYTSIQAAEVVA